MALNDPRAVDLVDDILRGGMADRMLGFESQLAFLDAQLCAGRDSRASREEQVRLMASRAVDWDVTYSAGGVVMPLQTDLPSYFRDSTEDVPVREVRVVLHPKLREYRHVAILAAEAQVREQLNEALGLPAGTMHKVSHPELTRTKGQVDDCFELRVRFDDEILYTRFLLSERAMQEGRRQEEHVERRLKAEMGRTILQRLGLDT